MKRIVKGIYDTLPLKREVFHILRRFWQPEERFYKHLYFSGDFVVDLGADRTFRMRHYGFQIENELFWSGLNGWERTSLSLWMKLAKASDVILDIGANTGVYSLIAKSVNRECRMIAFEPVVRVFKRLETNLAINDFDVACELAALSNRDGTATIFDTPTDHILSVTVNKNLNAENTEVIPTEINTVRLDSYIEQNKLDKIDLMKIDVETHEPEVLEGFGKYLSEFRPSMLIEILNDTVASRIQDQLEGLGYVYYNIDEATDSIRKTEGLTKSDYYNFLVCSPEKAQFIGLD